MFTLASDDEEVALQPLIKTETSNDCQSQQTAAEAVLCMAAEMAKSGHELGETETPSVLILQWNVERQCVLSGQQRVKITRARVI